MTPKEQDLGGGAAAGGTAPTTPCLYITKAVGHTYIFDRARIGAVGAAWDDTLRRWVRTEVVTSRAQAGAVPE